MPQPKPNYDADIVLVTGSREWTSENTIHYWLLKFPKLKLVVHGSARGADLMAENVCKKLQIPYMGVPAQWKNFKKAAGHIRNKVMLEWIETLNDNKYGAPNFEVQVLAFHLGINTSKGTKNMMEEAKRYCFPVYLVDKIVLAIRRSNVV